MPHSKHEENPLAAKNAPHDGTNESARGFFYLGISAETRQRMEDLPIIYGFMEFWSGVAAGKWCHSRETQGGSLSKQSPRKAF